MSSNVAFIFVVVIVVNALVVHCSLLDYKTACHGTNNGATYTLSKNQENTVKDRLQQYKKRYSNCTYVDGNLEIVSLESEALTASDLDFLSDIQEVTGYVLILQNSVSNLHLERLRIIRGENLYQGKYSLYVAMNYFNYSTGSTGLRELGLSSLNEITVGDVFIKHNSLLCHSNTVMWQDILADPRSNWYIDEENQRCSSCDDNCSSGHCWGDGFHLCQTLTRQRCAPQCNGRCYGDKPQECCNVECAAGCTGPRDSDCLACQRFIDNGRCIAACEPLQRLNRQGKLVPNPEGKYMYGIQCVKQCPPNYIADIKRSACLSECENGKHLGSNGQCIDDTKCADDNSNCSIKECIWDEEDDGLIHANNIYKLTNCTRVRGGLRILTASVDGDSIRNIRRMDVAELNVLKTVEEIIGFLVINGRSSRSKARIRSLNFLSKLKFIHSQGQVTNSKLLEISGTGLERLDLNSLEKVGFGDISIIGNKDLCFVESINWTVLQRDGGPKPVIQSNRNMKACENETKVCSKSCKPTAGCWGPDDDQCIECTKYRSNRRCVESCSEQLNVYADEVLQECLSCHSQCQNATAACSGPGPDKCYQCRHFSYNNTCVQRCTPSQYVEGKFCFDCHPYCVQFGCSGPGNGIGPGKCNKCPRVRLTDGEHPTVAECLDPKSSECGIGYEKLQSNCTDDDTCIENTTYITACIPVALAKEKHVAIIAGVVVGGCFFIGLITIAILLLRRQLAKVEEKKLRLAAKLSGVIACEEITPTNAKPDLSVLRLIKESELNRRHIIGSGAFGTVYKGFWVPEGENIRIPVAIKVLQGGKAPVQSQELLAEARIMASVKHPCCTQLLAVCLASEMMIVTQLMPLGSLLDYVRKNQGSIGSKTMLNWCTQIARGMAYLESMAIIHRDLAARNVLVHSENHVKITDFGLAKLVNENSEFHAEGEKMPIKWLALECIKHRVYSHKSDVWSFGVTLWEIFTYGKRPYEGVRVTDIVTLVEKGERLQQPTICTIDIYMLMIQCWLLDAECRPSFESLARDLANMSHDPARYLVISNDALMRLPSQTSVDPREILRSIASQMTVEGPEQVVLADEYINDQFTESINRPPPPHRMPTRLEKLQQIPDNRGAADNQKRNLNVKQLTTELGLPDDVNDTQRYSPNPCSLNKETFALLNQSSVKNPDTCQVTLRTDEDAYLQPRSSAPDAYLDLTDNYLCPESTTVRDEEGKVQNCDVLAKKGLLSRLDAVDNPEYYGQPSPISMETSPFLGPSEHH